MNDTDIAYIAGFFDGEGSCSLQKVRDRHGKERHQLMARITQNDRAVLEWIKSQIGVGTIVEKKESFRVNTNHALQMTARSARVLLVLIEPYLKVKKDHVSALLDITGRDTDDRRKKQAR